MRFWDKNSRCRWCTSQPRPQASRASTTDKRGWPDRTRKECSHDSRRLCGPCCQSEICNIPTNTRISDQKTINATFLTLKIDSAQAVTSPTIYDLRCTVLANFRVISNIIFLESERASCQYIRSRQRSRGERNFPVAIFIQNNLFQLYWPRYS